MLLNINSTEMFTLLSKSLAQRVLVTLRCTYKSSISLDKLYPQSDLNALSKPEFKVKPA
jgi:hypothetical protein